MFRSFASLVVTAVLLAGGPAPLCAQSTSAGAELQGRVTDAATGRPLSDVNVAARQDGRRVAGAVTDSSGRYTLRLAPGPARVTFSRVGYRAEARTLQENASPGASSEGSTRRLDVGLQPSTYSLNEIVVEESSVGGAAQTSTIQRVTPSSIERQDATSVADLGELIPAAHVQTNSRGQTLLYIRGAGDRQIGQFLDGALLNVPWDNRVDVGLLPAGAIESIAVAKGVPPVRYGTNVLGGAVNVQSSTLDAQGQETTVRAQAGTAGFGHGALTHLGRSGPWTYTAAVEATTQGDQPLPDGAAVPFSQPGETRRVNTDRRLLSAFARAGRQLQTGAEVSVTAFHVDSEQGIAPESHVDPSVTGVRYWRYPVWRKSMLIGSARVPLGPGTVVRGAVWGSRFRQDIDQYRTVEYDALDEMQSDRDDTAGLRAILTQRLLVGTATVSVNALTTQHRQTNVVVENGVAGSDSTTRFRQHLYSAGVEYDVDLTPRLHASTGVSLDGTDVPKAGPFPSPDRLVAPGVTAGLRADLGQGWAVRASGGRKSRFPTLRERFGVALGKFVPNPDLDPVTAWMGDAGVEWDGANASGSVLAFLNRVTDTIGQRTFQTGPNAGREQRINLAGSRVWGVEASGAWTPGTGWTVRGHGTWLRPRGLRETESGATRSTRLDEKPAWIGMAMVTRSWASGVSVTTQATYTGGTYARTEANTFQRLPDAWIWDVRAAVSLDRLWTSAGTEADVFVRVDNLTDTARYIQLGLPGPGRQLRIGLDVTL